MQVIPKLIKGVLAVVAGLTMILGGSYLVKWGAKTIHEELKSQSKGHVTATDKVRKSAIAVEATRTASLREIGVWTFTHRDRFGNVVWRESLHNTLSKIADQRILEYQFRGGSAPGASYYIGLTDTTTTCSITKADSTATVWGYGEPSGNGYSRQGVTKDATGWPTSAASGNDWHIVSKVVTFTASGGSIGPACCAVLSDQASGTAGDWHAWAALSVCRTMASGESLDVSMDITLQ